MASVTFSDVSFCPGRGGFLRSCSTRVEGNEASVLSHLNGCLPGGSMTLILSPPGHGKTSFMRALAGRLPASAVSGSVTVGGTQLYPPPTAPASSSAHTASSVSFLEQTDAHLPQLTVRETLLFAARNVLPAGCGVTAEERVEGISSALGLGECMDTQVGSDTVRGISGGQRQRLSIAECLLSPYTRLLCLDEATTGLDAAVALTLLTYIRQTWARRDAGSAGGSDSSSRAGAGVTVVAALLQPTPEICALFDQVICLQHGRAVYMGPPSGLLAYMQAQAAAGRPGTHVLACPPDTEPAEYAVQCLSTVRLPVWGHGQTFAGENPQLLPRYDAPPPPPVGGRGRGRYALSLAQHTRLVVARQAVLVYRDGAYLSSHLLQATFMGLLLGSLFYLPDPNQFNLKISVVLFAAFLLAFNSMPEVSTAAEQKRVVLKHARQGVSPPAAYALASTLVLIPVCAAESAILGSCVYWMVGYAADSGRAAFFLLVLFLCDLGLSAYFRALACALPSAPVAEALAAPSTGVFILFSGFLVTRLQIPSWLIWLYYLSPFSWMLRSISQGEFLAPVPSPYGYTPPGLPEDGLNTYGVIYLNVFEMQIERAWMWAGVAYLAGFLLLMMCCVGGSLTLAARSQERPGSARASAAAVGDAAEAGGALLVEAQVVPVQAAVDTKGEGMGKEGKKEAADAPTESSPARGTRGSWLTFDDLRYTIAVPVPPPSSSAASPLTRALWSIRAWLASALPSARLAAAIIPHTQRTLLDGITAYAAPGTLTAVMGASGAGKSTLFDVLMGLKTVGRAAGSVYVDGVCVIAFSRASRAASLFHTGLAGYVQQSDLHEPTATVLEALRFSAALRLPGNTTAAGREAVVAKVMQQLELTEVGQARVGGSSGGEGGEGVLGWALRSLWERVGRRGGGGAAKQARAGASLSPGQRKRLTIAVELVAQPSLLLLDEPTSGLDAREAAVVMRVLRRLASEDGLTVLATIHQPSSEVFSSFDQLLLLAAGGRQVYFGPVKAASEGDSLPHSSPSPSSSSPPALLPLAHALCSAMPSMPPLPAGKNPASWCLECLESVYVQQGLPGSDVLQSAYRASPWAARAFAVHAGKAGEATAQQRQWRQQRTSCTPMPHLAMVWWQVLLRDARASARDAGYTWARILAQAIVALLFGALFWRLQRLTAGGVETALAVWWMSLVFTSLLFFSTALPQAVRTRAVTHRESVTGMYPPALAGLSRLLVEVPWLVLTTTMVSAIVYGMVGGAGGLSGSNRAYSNYWSCMTLLALAYNSLGHWFAAWFPTLAIAQNIGYLGQAVLFLFGGLFVPLPSVPRGWLWLVTINPLRYAAHSVWSYQFFCDQDALDFRGRGERCPMFTQDPLPFPIREWEFIRAFLGLEYGSRDADAATLWVFLAVYTAAALLTLQLVNHIKR